MARYALTIFLSAFLLFQVQPLIGKFILPWFGGSPAVWTTCMLFFQVVLLTGYSYAHLITSKLSPKAQTTGHIVLLLLSLAFLPIAPDAQVWKPADSRTPIIGILSLLTFTIGLPYFLLSSTGPLLQESFRRETGRTPYRLYALSNIGSLLALLTYPFLFEPQLTVWVQIRLWSWSYGLFVLLCGWSAFGLARPALAGAGETSEPIDAGPPPSARDVALWLALAACGSAMLLATTNQLCLEVSSVPFLWIMPLAIYLFTFIICFDHERWYHRGVFLVLLAAAVLLACYALSQGNAMRLWQQLLVYSATLWVCCMVCHGELAHSKPAPRYATLFYLMVAAGGAVGGILVALVAPLVLRDFWEYQIGLILTVILAAVSTLAGSGSRAGGVPRLAWIIASIVCISAGFAIGVGIGLPGDDSDGEKNLETTRNFYGVLRVNQLDDVYEDNGPKRELIHGRIQHGFQYLDRNLRLWPTTYYGRSSGVGVAIDHHPRRANPDPDQRTLRIGVVGLGCGTLAAYGNAGDYVCFYEINPEVIRISDEYFTYRQDTAAEVEVILGDARIEMERQKAEGKLRRFDVLAIDAFSSDSIPMHLLTKQCVELYREHLKPDGLLCIHISNRFLDLGGVVAGIAEAVGCQCVFIDSDSDNALGTDRSTWAILTTNEEFLKTPEVTGAILSSDEHNEQKVIWTDDYGSLWQVLQK